MSTQVTPVGYVQHTDDAQSAAKVDDNVGLHVDRRYHPGVCHGCYAKPSPVDPKRPTLITPLLRCSQCQLVVYCSKDCQRRDWKAHKAICVVNKVVNGENVFASANEAIANGQTWDKFKDNLCLIACINLKRKLFQYEREMLLFPRVCEVCKSSYQPTLACCLSCFSVFYCSPEHMEQDAQHHQQYCMQYLLMLECDQTEVLSGIQDLPFPPQLDEVYTRLPSKLMILLNKQRERADATRLNPKRVTLVTERLSYPLSLLYALQNIDFVVKNKSLENVTSLRVHIVGATSLCELLGIIRWEYLVHRLPAIKSLHFVFVGPDLYSGSYDHSVNPPEDHILDDSGMTMCESCSSQDRRIVYEMYNRRYDEYKSSNVYTVPDVVVAYNCGLHEPNSFWSSSLALLVQHQNVPFVFTSYTTEEAKLDLETLQQITPVEVLMETRLNPFHSLRPYRDCESNDKPIFFWNQYITCVRAEKP